MLEQLIISLQIILIDIVMVADNAIIIGLIAANFAPENRKKIIAWGVGAAFIFRIFFATGANYIFEFAWVKILGGVLLLWVINNLRQDFFGKNVIRSPQLKSRETKSFSLLNLKLFVTQRLNQKKLAEVKNMMKVFLNN